MSFTTTAAESRQIAANIKAAIDPGVLMRLGARDFCVDGTTLIFRIGPARGKMRKVSITLTADDLYVVKGFEMRGSFKTSDLRCETVFEEGTDAHGGLYYDMLDDSLLRLEREVLGA